MDYLRLSLAPSAGDGRHGLLNVEWLKLKWMWWDLEGSPFIDSPLRCRFCRVMMNVHRPPAKVLWFSFSSHLFIPTIERLTLHWFLDARRDQQPWRCLLWFCPSAPSNFLCFSPISSPAVSMKFSRVAIDCSTPPIRDRSRKNRGGRDEKSPFRNLPISSPCSSLCISQNCCWRCSRQMLMSKCCRAAKVVLEPVSERNRWTPLVGNWIVSLFFPILRQV